MNKTEISILQGVMFLIMGIIFGYFYKELGKKTSNFYFKVLKIRFSEKGYQFIFLMGGVIFFIVGLLTVFQLITFK